MAGDQQRRQRGLCFGIALAGREFEPAPALGTAWRHAFALKVAEPDAIFRRGKFGLGGAGDKLEAGIQTARVQSSLPLLEKPRCPAEVEPTENQRIRPLDPHNLDRSG
jgi:hypothetical protein